MRFLILDLKYGEGGGVIYPTGKIEASNCGSQVKLDN